MGFIAMLLFALIMLQIGLSVDPQMGILNNGCFREKLICAIGFASLILSIGVVSVAIKYETRYKSIIERADQMGKVERTDDGLKWNSYPIKLIIEGPE